jgi:hypothetical protein
MVNNSTNINKTKQSLNRDGQQFHQYQLNEQSPPTSPHTKATIDGVGSPGSGLRQAQNVAGLNWLIGSQPSLLDSLIPNIYE